MSAKSVSRVFKNSAAEFMEDRVLTLSAALAYYAIFSIAPLLVIIIGVAGLAFGEPAARHQIADQIQGFVGPNAARMVQSMMAAQQKSGSLIATIVGTVLLLLGASGVFGQLKDSLNAIWRVKAKPGRGVVGLILDRLLALLMVIAIGVLLLLSMAMTTAISAFYGVIETVIPIPSFLIQLFNLVLGLGVSTLLFALIFKLLPDVKIRWRDVWIGAFGTALLFTVGEYLLSLYLGRKSTASAYGAAGSAVVILMWIYYSSLILFFGAEVTQAYAEESGSPILPGKFAIPANHREQPEAAQAEPPDRTADERAPKRPAPIHPTRRPRPQEGY